jgi:hypothetical protein
MSHYVEAIVAMFPPDAGGRSSAVLPRDGSYRPFARLVDGPLLRVRFIEGPPQLVPGETARVVIEVDGSAVLHVGAEIEILEHSIDPVGVATICALRPGAIPA